jgi:hypothetical protein
LLERTVLRSRSGRGADPPAPPDQAELLAAARKVLGPRVVVDSDDKALTTMDPER